jgi:hypothetical protein
MLDETGVRVRFLARGKLHPTGKTVHREHELTGEVGVLTPEA